MLAGKMLSTISSGAQPIEYVGSRVVSYVGTTSNISVSLTSLSGGVSSAPEVGDLVLVYFGTASLTNRDLVVAGYTEIADIDYMNTGYTGTNLVAAYKFMSETPDTTVTITGGTFSSSDAGAVFVSVWRNVNTTTPLDVAARSTDDRFGADAYPLSITPVTAGAFIVVGAVGGHLQGTHTFTSSDLSDFKTAGRDDTYDITIGGGYKEWVSGTFAPARFGFTGTGGQQYDTACSITLALRPE